ncbi:hypothetical protein HDU85_007388 [Gaertneriomyces sp. JEL0708]|nr:hypothetical protein HDU85_007388 [Gaertneriomyces sp. JEL0708]
METTERQATTNGFFAPLPILDGHGNFGAPSQPDPSGLLVDNELEMFSDMGGAFWTSGETHEPFSHAEEPSSNLPTPSMTGRTPLVAPNGDAPRQNNLMNTDTFQEPEPVPSRRASSAADSIDTVDPHDKRHDRSLLKKKRNTEAARRSRMRRIAHTASLERQLERLREENHTLISRVAALEQARLRAEQACAAAEEARSKVEQARAHDQWTIRRMFNSVQEAKRYLDGSRRMAWTSGEAVPDTFENRMGGSVGLNDVDMSVLDSLAASTSSDPAPHQATNDYISDAQPPITFLDTATNSATVSSQPSCTAPAGQAMQASGMSSFHQMPFTSGIPSGQGGPTGANYVPADTPFISPASQAWPGYPSTPMHDAFTANPNPTGSNLPPPTPPYDPLSNLAVSSLTASWLSPSLRAPTTATETNYTGDSVYPDFTSSMIGLGNDYGMGFG